MTSSPDQPITADPTDAAEGPSDQALTITRIAAQAASDKLARDIVAFDVTEHLAITDVFLIASAPNERQVGAIVDGIEEALVKHGFKPVRREGDRENRWVLLDYLDVVVHVQHDEERQLYSLERLWRDCPRLDLPLDQPPTAAAGAE
ncbi:MAG TPA: ribosome silencing factor [Propionibacteriaceae bacterium]|nr:ribosome silencing factor [Propionibacteriaceae bacterium]